MPFEFDLIVPLPEGGYEATIVDAALQVLADLSGGTALREARPDQISLADAGAQLRVKWMVL